MNFLNQEVITSENKSIFEFHNNDMKYKHLNLKYKSINERQIGYDEEVKTCSDCCTCPKIQIIDDNSFNIFSL